MFGFLQREGAPASPEHHLHLPLGGILRVRLNRVRVVREYPNALSVEYSRVFAGSSTRPVTKESGLNRI